MFGPIDPLWVVGTRPVVPLSLGPWVTADAHLPDAETLGDERSGAARLGEAVVAGEPNPFATAHLDPLDLVVLGPNQTSHESR